MSACRPKLGEYFTLDPVTRWTLRTQKPEAARAGSDAWAGYSFPWRQEVIPQAKRDALLRYLEDNAASVFLRQKIENSRRLACILPSLPLPVS